MLLRRLKFLGWLAALLVIVLGGSYLFAPQWLMQANLTRQAMAAHMEKQAIQAGDTHWSYYEGGNGPTIVLLPGGFGTNKETWLDTAKVLGAHFHLVMPDLPGWGESSRDDNGHYDIASQASRFDAFVQALNLQGFILVGHGTGGAVAAEYAAIHPEHVAALALVDSSGLKGGHNAFDDDAATGPFVFDDRAGYQRVATQLFVQPPDLPGRFIDVLVKRNRNDRSFIERQLATQRDPAQSMAVQNRLGQLTMPVLGLWCHDDKVIDSSALDSLRNGLTAASAISASTLNGCSHLPMVEKPEQTAQILTGFALSH